MYSDQSKDILKEILKTLKDGLGGKSELEKKAITTTATQYSDGDCIGGVITLDSATEACNKTAILESLLIKDNSNQGSDLTVLFFDRHPVDIGGATCTDNSAFAYGNSLPYLIGQRSIATADYLTINSKKSYITSGINQVFKTLADGKIYMVIISEGTPTYGANSTSLEVDLGFLKD